MRHKNVLDQVLLQYLKNDDCVKSASWLFRNQFQALDHVKKNL